MYIVHARAVCLSERASVAAHDSFRVVLLWDFKYCDLVFYI